MFRLIIITILLVIPGQVSAQNWSFHLNPNEAGTGYIKYGQEGFQNLGDAFSKVPAGIEIKKIEIGMLNQLKSDSIQSDLFSFFRNNLPEKLTSALKAFEQNKRPNLLQLEYFFSQALFGTQYVKSLKRELKTYGYRMSAIYHEDLLLIRENDQIKFDTLIEITIAPFETT